MRILIALLLFTSVAFGQENALPQQGPPPKHLERRADGRFSANLDPEAPEKFEVHVVVKGETLSGISGDAMKNPRLWPQLWEQNEHIVNPHWIYPDDKILIRPVVQITEAAPPPPEPAAEPAPAPEPSPVARRQVIVPIQTTTPPKAQDIFEVSSPPVVPEIKTVDLYCSGMIRTDSMSNAIKVISKVNADRSALAVEEDYIYVSKGSAEGVKVGDIYQVIRPTKDITTPARSNEHNRGRHYLDVAQIRVVIAQPDFALARVVHSCEAAEIGDLMIPFQRINLPPLQHPRPFSPFMTASGQTKGVVISTKNSLENFGSAFKGTGKIPGVRQGDLKGLERGVAAEGAIAYVDIGNDAGVKPGDVFIVFRETQLDGSLYKLPREARKLRGQRTAIAELVILKVGELASTALVTYAVDGIALGDAVERR